MYHYFDDTFHRHTNTHARPARSRRSSTARSMGARSDFEEPPVGLGIRFEGDEEEVDDAVDGDRKVKEWVEGKNGGEVTREDEDNVEEQLGSYSFGDKKGNGVP